MNERHYRARVVHGRAFVADGLVENIEKFQPLCNNIAHGVSKRPNALEVLGHDERFFRHVKPRHDDGNAGLENDLRRLRVNENVELRRGRPVAVGDTAAHERDLLDLGFQLRVRQQERGYIRLRTCGDDRDRLRRLTQHLRHELDRREAADLHRRFGKCRTVQARFSVHRRGVHHVGCQRVRAAFGDGCVDAQQRADAKGIVGRFFNADVAAARRDGQNVEPAAPLRQRPANRVVMARVAV